MKQDSVVTLFPTAIKGTVNVPSSKSLTHRAILCASLARGKSTISNIVFSEDINATLSAIEQLGAKVERSASSVTIKGVKSIKAPNSPVDCNESGSTLRFLIPLLSLSGKKVTLTGKQSLLQRPQSVYEELFKEDDIFFSHTQDEIVVNGSVKARRYYIDGTISSQFFTGLMLALPLLKDDSYIYIKGGLESKGYIDLTMDILEQYGVVIDEIENGYFIEGNQSYKPFDYTVEGDYSQAAFFLVGGILNGTVTLTNLSHESLQGDREIIEIIKRMKGKLIYTENGFIAKQSDTYGTKIDVSNCPDLGPIVALLGALSKGTTTIQGTSRLRIKESDRIESTVKTLKALGATIKTVKDDIVIYGKSQLDGGTVDSFNDHRIAMMASIASTVCENPVTITQASAINKSYPHFYKDLRSLGCKISTKEEDHE